MKTLWIVALGFLLFFVVTSSVAQASEQVIPAENDYFLAISFEYANNPNLKRFKFKESITRLNMEALNKKLEQIKGVQSVFLYPDGIAIARKVDSARKVDTPWGELEKEVMLILKDQFKVTGYVLFDGSTLTGEQIKRLLSVP